MESTLQSISARSRWLTKDVFCWTYFSWRSRYASGALLNKRVKLEMRNLTIIKALKNIGVDQAKDPVRITTCILSFFTKKQLVWR